MGRQKQALEHFGLDTKMQLTVGGSSGRSAMTSGFDEWPSLPLSTMACDKFDAKEC